MRWLGMEGSRTGWEEKRWKAASMSCVQMSAKRPSSWSCSLHWLGIEGIEERDTLDYQDRDGG
jgi:hypothetical protein